MLCYKCFCSTAAGRIAMAFVRSLIVFLCGPAGVLCKGSSARALYDAGRAVLRVFRKGRSETLRPKDSWFHLSFGNLQTGVFWVVRLTWREVSPWEEGSNEITLHGETQKAADLWSMFLDIDINKDFDAEIWKLTDSDAIEEIFEPGVFTIERHNPNISGKAWRSNPPWLLPVSRPPRTNGAPPPPPIPIEWTVGGDTGVRPGRVR